MTSLFGLVKICGSSTLATEAVQPPPRRNRRVSRCPNLETVPEDSEVTIEDQSRADTKNNGGEEPVVASAEKWRKILKRSIAFLSNMHLKDPSSKLHEYDHRPRTTDVHPLSSMAFAVTTFG